MIVPFNIPYLTGKEVEYIALAINERKFSGNGKFTQNCQKYFGGKGFYKSLLTTSCTDALEMAALLLDIQPGDEVIMPSYTFVSTANAFVLRGANIRFIDSRPDHPGMDESKIEAAITEKTRAIVPVHYAGVACDMDRIIELAQAYGLFVVEDAAQAIDSYYKGRPLGGISDLGAFSFHETKNVISGEGGLLSVNNATFADRSEIIWEKGTNRAAFWRGEVNKYGWVDIGSSFLPSEITAAFLYAQLEHLEDIQNKRKSLWNRYFEGLKELGHKGTMLPHIPSYATNNAHMFYLVCNDAPERAALISHLSVHGVNAVFHYLSLHKSMFYKERHTGGELPFADRYSQCLLRLPLYYGLEQSQQDHVIDKILEFYATA